MFALQVIGLGLREAKFTFQIGACFLTKICLICLTLSVSQKRRVNQNSVFATTTAASP